MSDSDILDHPDLSKAWVVLESTAPTVEWEDLLKSEALSTDKRRPVRRILAIVAAGLLMVLVGTETVGVFAASRAIASGSVIVPQPVAFEITSQELADPASLAGPDGDFVVSDVTATSSMVLAYIVDLEDLGPWYDSLFRLTDHGWELFGIDLDHIIDSTVVAGSEYVLGFREGPEPTDHTPRTRDYLIYSVEPGSESPTELSAMDYPSLIAESPAGVVVLSNPEENSYQLWESADGQEWTQRGVFEAGRVNDLHVDGDQILLAGLKLGLIPFEELGNHTLWTQRGDDSVQEANIEGLRSLGFGYLIGGFRVSDGLEDIVQLGDTHIAYTGSLQIWEGFTGDGLALEPREAWSSLVVVSDGSTWTAHLLPDITIHQMVPFGEGLLAAAARTPESDTRTIELEDATSQTVAVSPRSHLYYSQDGLTWRPVDNSPEFGKPLLQITENGNVIAVDEHQVEDRTTDTATVHTIKAP